MLARGDERAWNDFSRLRASAWVGERVGSFLYGSFCIFHLVCL
jgi:hypothetical protein